MKGFAMDEKGDVLIENNEISIVVGDSLLQQRVLTILRTNLKEWFFDWKQGVDFANLIGKTANADLARFEIERGLAQVDDTFVITEFEYTADIRSRKAKVMFKAQTQGGEEVGGELTWD